MSIELQTAIDGAEQAGKVLMKYFGSSLDVKHKDGKFDPVTKADSEADELLRTLISKQFPGDQLLTEEHPSRPSAYDERVWMVDPLDGTKDFILGRDTFSVIIGLLSDGLPALGIVYLPARDELYYAETGKGAHMVAHSRVAPIKSSAINAVSEARMLVRIPTAEPRKLDKPLGELGVKERMTGGSVGSRLCAIASGQADLFINTHHRVSKWDTLGPEMILTEAGGMVVGLSGQQLDYTRADDRWSEPFVAASTPQLAADAIKLVGRQSF